MNPSVRDLPFVKLPLENSVALKDLKICFCVDNSGSTGTTFFSETNVLDVEKEFVKKIIPYLTQHPSFIAWNTIATNMTSLDAIQSIGGTKPSSIFLSDTIGTIKKSDVIVLITDGQIGSTEIQKFGEYMTKFGTHFKAIIGVIVDKKETIVCTDMPYFETDVTTQIVKPSQINVSVLVPAMISNGCIIFNDLTANYNMWSCGTFKSTWNPMDITEETGWSAVTTVNTSQIIEIMIPFANINDEHVLTSKGYIPLGLGLYFHPNYLLNSTPSWEELIEFPFDRICQNFKVTKRCTELIVWFKKLKNKFFEEFVIGHIEREHVDKLMDEIISTRRIEKNSDLLTMYTRNRNRALAFSNDADEEIDQLITDPRLINLIQFFRNMMEIMKEDEETQDDPGTYTTSSLSPSRYLGKTMKNKFRTSGSNDILVTISANFTDPFKWFAQFCKLYPQHNSPTCECSICYESSVPFILIRKHFDTNNLNELLKFPTSFFYPQIVCSKCAGYFCNLQIDPVRVPCYSAVPLVTLIDDSKKYFILSFAHVTNCVINFSDDNSTLSDGSSIKYLYGLFNSLVNSNRKSNKSESVANAKPDSISKSSEKQISFILSLLCTKFKESFTTDPLLTSLLDQFNNQF